MSKIEIHRSEDRGRAEEGWLHSRHSFSFADYYNPKRMAFGALRVLNDDVIEPGQGFGTHGHDNMEIITIVLEGTLQHEDSEGHRGLIRPGDVQRMSAGTGIRHSEFNASDREAVHLLQIWIYPRQKNLKPGYEQKSFDPKKWANELGVIVSGGPNDKAVLIHQDAFFSRGILDAGRTVSYRRQKTGNGIYLFLIAGEISLQQETLRRGDAAAISGPEAIDFRTVEKTDILMIEVPLQGY